ncbi:recombinase family protein [Maribacter sp. CXY002]|uniref:recombinase family protein n=1 Tax=Maribacter luteocoastalis TaxID=3407671 RepID=UPI003B67979F
MKAKYIRVSTTEQNTDRQKEGGYKLYIDKVSGSVPFNKRPQAIKLLNDGSIKEVYVQSIDRLGRNTMDILSTIKEFTSKGINVVSQKEGLSTLVDGKESPTSKMVLSIMATLSEFELSTIKERQREGIERAKQRGAYKANGGSKPLSVKELLAKPKNAKCAKELRSGESIRRAAKLSGVSHTTAMKIKNAIR